ncbi:hypothetical protein Tco_1567773, partial [Tanacetum coccineum]
MAEGLSGKMLMEHGDAQGQSVFTSRAWRRLFEIRGLLVESSRQISNKGDLSAYWREISSEGDFLGAPPSYTHIRDPMLRLCHRLIACNIARRSQVPEKVAMTDLFYLSGMDVGSLNIPYLLARYLRLLASGRKRGVMLSRGQFIDRLICKELKDTWAWVALGPERQQVVGIGTPKAAEDAPVVDEGAPAVPAPAQAPQPPPAAGLARNMPQRMARLEEDVHEIRGALTEQRKVIDAMAKDLSRFTIWAAGDIAQLL